MDLDKLIDKMISASSVGSDESNLIPMASGVYTAWLSGETRCFYVGNSKQLRERIKDHFRGTRSNDQFCLYVYDEYIHELRCRKGVKLNSKEINKLTGKWIQSKIKFKWVELDKSYIRNAEDFLKRKLRPILNPL